MEHDAFVHLACSDDFRGGHAVSTTEQLLKCEIEVVLELQQSSGVTMRMDEPGGGDAQFAFLVTQRQGIGFVEPFREGRIFAVNQLAPGEETVAKGSACRSFHHALEPSSRN